MARKVLITGKDSYVGTSLIKWMAEHEPEKKCVEISVRGEEWKQFDFSPFDSVLHVAGIAHQKETQNNKNSYFEVNYKLAVQVAKKSYNSGVPHFVFLSSMSIFGLSSGEITSDTKPIPNSYYGESKLLAETEILKIPFRSLTVIRPPMIYGYNCKGNYQILSKMSKYLPIFPNIQNLRSMIYIDNLSEFIRIVINDSVSGILHPQNEEFVETAELVSKVRQQRGKKTLFVSVFNPILFSKRIHLFEKIFGTLIYSKEISSIGLNYNVVKFEQSIDLTEQHTKK